MTSTDKLIWYNIGMDAKWNRTDIPFKVERSAAGSLSKQMTDGLREAIVSGHYKPGDVLPTILEWSKLLDVSIRVPEAAVAALQAGADILLGTRDYPKVFEAVVAAVESGRLSEERINQSVRRILALRQSIKK